MPVPTEVPLGFTPAFNEFDNVTLEDSSPRAWYDRDDLFIHPHWWKYDIDSIPSEHFYLAGIYIGWVGIIGTFGNGLVIYTYFKNRSLRTPPNMLVINLSVSDLVFSAVNGFPLFTIASFQKRWNWGMKTCELYGLIGGIFGIISINTNAFIALDRYFVIAQPVKSMRKMTRSRAGMIIVFIWFWSTLWCVLPIGGLGAYIPEGFQTSCTFDYLTRTQENIIYNIGIYVTGYIIPVSLMFFCYYQIVKAVVAHEREMAAMAQKLGAKDMRSGSDVRNDLKTAKVGFTVCFCYLMAWSPYALLGLFGLLGKTAYINPYVSEIAVLFAKTSAMYNPIIYAVSHPKFRLAMEKEVPFLFTCCKTKESALSRTSTTGGSRMSETSDISAEGSVRRVPMKDQKAASTTTINTVAGSVQDAPADRRTNDDTAEAKTEL